MASKADTFIRKGVTYQKVTKEVVSCLFCRIHSREEPGKIAYEDEKFVAFHTIQPATYLHLLITPRKHIANVGSLKGAEGAELVRELMKAGRAALGEQYAKDAKFCFHIPPWNSIDHLHLHAIASPQTRNWWNYCKYPDEDRRYCQSAQSIITKLEKQAIAAAKGGQSVVAAEEEEVEVEGEEEEEDVRSLAKEMKKKAKVADEDKDDNKDNCHTKKSQPTAVDQHQHRNSSIPTTTNKSKL